MKYRTTQSFIAFGKTCEPGQVVELTEDQAAALTELDAVVPYETKVAPPPENKAVKKSSAVSRPARVPRKQTRKNSRKSATK